MAVGGEGLGERARGIGRPGVPSPPPPSHASSHTCSSSNLILLIFPRCFDCCAVIGFGLSVGFFLPHCGLLSLAELKEEARGTLQPG